MWNLVTNTSKEVAAGLAPAKKGRPQGSQLQLEKLSKEEKNLWRKINITIKKVTADIDPVLHYNTAISAIMELVNEIHKVLSLKTSVSSVEPSQVSSKPVIGEAIRTVVLLLAPMVPHLAEELWEKLGNNDTIFKQLWPSYDKNAIQADEIELPVQVNGRLRSRITVPAMADEETIKQKALADEKIKSALGGKPPRKMIVVPKRLVNIVVS